MLEFKNFLHVKFKHGMMEFQNFTSETPQYAVHLYVKLSIFFFINDALYK